MASRLFFNSASKVATRGTLRQYSATASSSAKEKYFSELQHTRDHAKKSTDLWRKISLYVCGPVIALISYNAYLLAKEHAEHIAHHPYEYKPWPHLRIRNKGFPWGDGDKSLFHNPEINLGPPKDE